MKYALLISVIFLSGCASSCAAFEGLSIGNPETTDKNIRIIPKYWNI